MLISESEILLKSHYKGSEYRNRNPISQVFGLISRVFGPFSSFQTSKLSFSFGNRILEPSRNRPVSYRSANSKKSHFCRTLFVSLNKSVENSVLRSFIPVSDFSSFDNERLRRSNLNEQNIFLFKNIPKRP